MPTVNMETLRIDEILYEFVNREAMPGAAFTADRHGQSRNYYSWPAEW